MPPGWHILQIIQTLLLTPWCHPQKTWWRQLRRGRLGQLYSDSQRCTHCIGCQFITGHQVVIFLVSFCLNRIPSWRHSLERGHWQPVQDVPKLLPYNSCDGLELHWNHTFTFKKPGTQMQRCSITKWFSVFVLCWKVFNDGIALFNWI